MRIHTNTLTAAQVYAAARTAGVDVESMSEHGSRSRSHAFDVILSGSGRTGGQWGNTGKNGAAAYKSATWDEWGIFLAALFDADDTTMTRDYPSADAFHWITNDRYRYLTKPFVHVQHKWSHQGTAAGGSYYVSECTSCEAVLRRPAHGYTLADLIDA